MPDSLQIFISSPGDVGQERIIAERVVKRLRGEFSGRVRLEPVLWERQPLRATEHFQEQIVPPAKTDIAVFILWSRLGTPLPTNKFRKESGEAYKSGTEWEFENAVQSYRETGTPDLLTYRKTKTPQAPLTDEVELKRRLDQKKALDSFIEHWFRGDGAFTAAFQLFETPSEFESMLEGHLRKLIQDRLPEQHTREVAPEARWHKGSPFRGLQSFTSEHAPVFFGRTKAVSEIVDALVETSSDGRPFVLVLGPSGCGKSSVVQAGVVPTITQSSIVEDVGLWCQAQFRLSDAPSDPLMGLARALLAEESLSRIKTYGFDADAFADLLREAPSQAARPIQQALSTEAEAQAEEARLSSVPEVRLLLVLDQLEEIFTLDALPPKERSVFMEAIRALVENGPVWTIATMRSDFYPQCTEIDALSVLKQGRGQYDLTPPSFAEIGQMIRHPAQAAGLQFERDADRREGLDEVLHEAAAQAPEALPLLEFTLEELYQRREGRVLTFEAYEALGGLEGALTERAEEVYQTLDTDAQTVLPEILESLVTIRQDDDAEVQGAGASRRVSREEVARTDARAAFVDAFVEARLFVTSRNDHGEAVVSVAHEALLREWPRIRRWVERNRDFLRTRARLGKAASRWHEEGRPDDLLLPEGRLLDEGREVLEAGSANLGHSLRAFVTASLKQAERKRKNRRYLMATFIVAFFLVSTGFGLFSYYQWTEAAQQHDETLRSQSKYFADMARDQVAQGDGMTGMLLALDALPGSPTAPDRPYVPDAEAALYHALVHNREQWIPQPHRAPILASSISPNGRYLVTHAMDSTAQIYDLDQQTVTAVLEGHDGPVWDAEFDARSRRIVTTGDTTARVWSVPDGRSLQVVPHRDSVLTAIFSPDGAALLTTTKDTVGGFNLFRKQNAAHLWPLASEAAMRTFAPPSKHPDARITRALFLPEQPYVLLAYADTSAAAGRQPGVFLWNRETGARRSVPLGAEDLAADLGFFEDFLYVSDDGTWLAMGSSRLVVVRLASLDIAYTKEMRVDKVTFGPANKRMLVASSDSLSVLDVPTGRVHVSIHQPDLMQSAFGDDGTHVAAGTRGGTVHLWSVKNGEKVREYVNKRGYILVRPFRLFELSEEHRYVSTGGPLKDVYAQPEANRVLAVTRNAVNLWSTKDQPGVTQLGGTTRYKGRPSLALSEGTIAAVTQERTPHLFEAGSGALADTLSGHDAPVGPVVFSAKGTRLATGDRDGTIRLWNPEQATAMAQLRPSTSEAVTDLLFLNDGERLLSVTAAPTTETHALTLWDVAAETTLVRIEDVRPDLVRVHPDRTRFLVATTRSGSAEQARDSTVTVVMRAASSGDVLTHIGDGHPIQGIVGDGTDPTNQSADRTAGISPDGRYVLCITATRVYVVRLDTGAPVGFFRENRTQATPRRGSEEVLFVKGHAFGDELSVPAYDLSEHREAYRLHDPSDRIQAFVQATMTATFAPDGQFLVTTPTEFGSNWTVRVLWEPSGSGAPPLRIHTALPLQRGTITPVRFGRNGRSVLVASDRDPTVHVYHVAPDRPWVRGQEHLALAGHEDGVTVAEWVPGSARILTRSATGRLRLWPTFSSTDALIDSARASLTRDLSAPMVENL